MNSRAKIKHLNQIIADQQKTIIKLRRVIIVANEICKRIKKVMER